NRCGLHGPTLPDVGDGHKDRAYHWHVKIAVAGLGYVGLSNAVLLAQRHEVVAFDIDAHRVAAVNDRRSPIEDPEIEEYLSGVELDLRATKDPHQAYAGARFVVVATPTDY